MIFEMSRTANDLSFTCAASIGFYDEGITIRLENLEDGGEYIRFIPYAELASAKIDIVSGTIKEMLYATGW